MSNVSDVQIAENEENRLQREFDEARVAAIASDEYVRAHPLVGAFAAGEQPPSVTAEELLEYGKHNPDRAYRLMFERLARLRDYRAAKK